MVSYELKSEGVVPIHYDHSSGRAEIMFYLFLYSPLFYFFILVWEKMLREKNVIDWNKIVTREVRHRLKQNCYERGTSSIETKLLRERYVIDWNKTSESFCDVLLMLIGSRQYIVIFPLNYWIELNWIESNVIWNLILLYIVNGTLNQLYIYMCDIRDRPFNLRGGYVFLFRSELFFRTTQHLEFFCFVAQNANFYSRM